MVQIWLDYLYKVQKSACIVKLSSAPWRSSTRTVKRHLSRPAPKSRMHLSALCHAICYAHTEIRTPLLPKRTIFASLFNVQERMKRIRHLLRRSKGTWRKCCCCLAPSGRLLARKLRSNLAKVLNYKRFPIAWLIDKHLRLHWRTYV